MQPEGTVQFIILTSHFYSCTSCEVQRWNKTGINDIDDFYSRTSCEVQLGMEYCDPTTFISTHAPLARCNKVSCAFKNSNLDFYSRTSCEVQLSKTYLKLKFSNFYSRTSCEVQLVHCHHIRLPHSISTHAPLARCNLNTLSDAMATDMISTHAPLARCNTNFIFIISDCWWFLLTHLLRGATRWQGL